MTYRERREAKAERLREWADKREVKATAEYAKAEAIADLIPLGQPILVGHHSEKRHRRDIERIKGGFERSFENSSKAGEFRRRADGIEAAAERSIYSDDADAIERLRERIAELEAERDRLKAFNQAVRKGTPRTDALQLLDEKQRENYLTVCRVAAFQIGKKGEFPSYAVSNLGGNINRNRKRLEKLESEAQMESGYTRLSVPTQLRRQGHSVTGGIADDGRLSYVIDGEAMTLEAAADRFLGGWENAFGKGEDV